MMTFKSTFANNSIHIDASLVESHLSDAQINSLQGEIDKAAQTLHGKTGPGSDFLGWLEPAMIIPNEELARIKETAGHLRGKTDFLVVIGIGGSYLGARACYEALRKPGSAYCLKYAGINMSADYHTDLIESLKDARFAINVISKSGTTTEPAIAFMAFREKLEWRIGHDNAQSLIVATTDAKKGALRRLADAEGWTSFIIPDDVGGRFSVLTPVGLFPLAYAGVDIDALLNGATDCAKYCKEKTFRKNPARLYTAIRYLLYKKGLSIELLASFEPRLAQLVEWWKQLAGESEGKNGRGLFPAGAIFSRDLHSLGQWIQDGPRILFETFLSIMGGEPSLKVPDINDPTADDGLSYLVGRELSDINRVACDATRAAHAQGGCPNLEVSVPVMDAYNLGALIYFFEYAIALTGYLLQVNPFDQPGVEIYKRNMFKLLGKPAEDNAK